MIARGFKSVIWAGTVGSAALGCYMVSLRVATERNELAKVERQIIATKQDMRALQTELGTRGRVTQLEQWNAEVLALAAPSSAQYLKDEFTLARFEVHPQTVEERSSEVHMAALETATSTSPAPAPARPVVRAVAATASEAPAAKLVRTASFTPEAHTEPALSAAKPAKPSAPKAEPKSAPVKIAAKPAAGPAKPEAAKPARLGKKLAQQLGAAERAEKAGGGDGH
jgi:hypothetical protein